jgi:hypothetical protein
LNPSIDDGQVVWEHYTNWPNQTDPIRIYYYDGSTLHENISQTPIGGIAELASISGDYITWDSETSSGREIFRYQISSGSVQQLSTDDYGNYSAYALANGDQVIWQDWNSIGTNVMLFNGIDEVPITPSPIPTYQLSFAGQEITAYVNTFPDLSGNDAVWTTTNGTTTNVDLAFVPEPAIFGPMMMITMSILASVRWRVAK